MLHLKDNKGFSLLELMITVAIIGILAGMAVPNYNEFARRTRIKMTVAQLIEIRNGIIGLRIVDDDVLMNITQSTCARCPFANVGQVSTAWAPNALAERVYRRAGMEGVQRDAWDQHLLLDENEREFAANDCRLDAITSVGENRTFEGNANLPPQGDDIRLWVPFYYPQNGCVNQGGIEFGPDVW
jgi:prepilin-type N-terminal cleavage/methylation domain-containing protein